MQQNIAMKNGIYYIKQQFLFEVIVMYIWIIILLVMNLIFGWNKILVVNLYLWNKFE